jgi:hypothetical protein
MKTEPVFCSLCRHAHSARDLRDPDAAAWDCRGEAGS